MYLGVRKALNFKFKVGNYGRILEVGSDSPCDVTGWIITCGNLVPRALCLVSRPVKPTKPWERGCTCGT